MSHNEQGIYNYSTMKQYSRQEKKYTHYRRIIPLAYTSNHLNQRETAIIT